MAIIRATTNLNQWLEEFYDSASLGLTSLTATGAVIQDVNGATITLVGKGLAEDGNAVTGTISGMTFKDSGGLTLMTLTGLTLKANNIFGVLYENANIFEMMSFATAGNDTITGTAGSDDLMIGRNFGNDTILGLAGDDYIKGSHGNNTMDGGADWDTLTYTETYYDHSSFQGIVLNATKGTVTNSWGGIDTIRNFEEFEGSKFADTFLGSKRDEVFKGLGGKDKIDGGAGNDEARYDRDAQYSGSKAGVTVDLNALTSGAFKGWGTATDGFGRTDYLKNIEQVRGTAQNDTITGNAKNNRLDGRDGVDTLNAGGGNDEVDGGAGNDVLDGGAGAEDTLIFWKSSTGGDVVVDLSANQVSDDGFGDADTATNFENIETAGGNDTLKLGTAGGWIWSDAGNDRLIAGSNTNGQWFGGGDGTDTFVFEATTLTAAGAGSLHWIDDFTAGVDKIELKGFGWSAPEFIDDDAFSGAAGEVRAVAGTGKTIITIDNDGDLDADFQFEIKGTPALTDSDFLFT